MEKNNIENSEKITEKKFEILEDKESQKNEIKESEKLKIYKGYVGFWKRFTASGLDGILTLLMIPAGYLITSTDTYYMIYVIIILAGIIIHTYFYFKDGMGLGYKIMGFKIIDQESGEKADTKKLIMRIIYKYFPYFILVLGAIIMFFTGDSEKQTLEISSFLSMGIGIITLLSLGMAIYYLVNAIMIGVDKNKRALWDKWAKTIVVSEKEWDGWKIWAINILAILLMSIFMNTPMEKKQTAELNGKMMDMGTEYLLEGEDYYESSTNAF